MTDQTYESQICKNDSEFWKLRQWLKRAIYSKVNCLGNQSDQWKLDQ